MSDPIIEIRGLRKTFGQGGAAVTALDGIDLSLRLDDQRCSVEIQATVSCDGRTGVEMEALTAVSTAALTVYDMCKAVQKDMVITDIRLVSKTGGVHGSFLREE